MWRKVIVIILSVTACGARLGAQSSMTAPAKETKKTLAGPDAEQADAYRSNAVTPPFPPAQGLAAAPQMPPDDGPSLEVTMKFIQSAFSNLGTISFLYTQAPRAGGEPLRMKEVFSFAEVSADSSACSLELPFRTSYTDPSGKYGSVSPSAIPWRVQLKGVTRIDVATWEDGSNRKKSPKSANVIADTSPQTYALTISEGDASAALLIPFSDQDLANRVAKALTRAVQLCGGGISKDLL